MRTEPRDLEEDGAPTTVAEHPTDADAAPPPLPLSPRPRPGVWGAISARPLLVMQTVLVFVLAGVAYGLARQPNYSAQTRLAVLHINFAAPGALSGFSTATAALADTYARAISANGVVTPLAARFHQSPQTIRSELSATAVPQTPIFTVTAKTPSRSRSIALVNAADQQLLSYLKSVSGHSAPSVVYQQLSTAETQLAAAQLSQQSTLARIRRQQHAAGTSAMSPQQQSQLAAAQGNIYARQQQVSSLRRTYAGSANAGNPQLAQQLTSASTATSDRRSKLTLAAFIGLVIGIGVAIGLAVLMQARRTRVPRISMPHR